jgi:hypothetical protein
MNKVPTILFQEKQASVLNVAKAVAPSILGGAITSGGMDYLAHGGDYSHVDAKRIGMGVFNALIGGIGGHSIGNKNLLEGVKTIALAPAKDVAFAAIPAIGQFQNTQKAIQEETQKSFLEKLSPKEKALLLAAGVGVSALSIPALMNLSNAAKRVGDGRSIRVSTSLRKRPNQDSDLTINVKNQDEASTGEETLSEQEQAQLNKNKSNLPQQQKGLLSRVFNF